MRPCIPGSTKSDPVFSGKFVIGFDIFHRVQIAHFIPFRPIIKLEMIIENKFPAVSLKAINF